MLESVVGRARPGRAIARGDGGPLEVVHVVLTLDMGGMERVVLSLIRGGRSLGQSVSVLCLERPGVLAGGAEAAGARVVALNLPGGIRRPGAAGAIAEGLRAIGPDVVHSHQIGALFHVGPAARREGVPLVVHTEHGDHFAQASGARKLRRRLIMALAGRHAARFFAVSAGIADGAVALGGQPRGKVRVVPNGIDTEAFASEGLAAAAAEARRALGIPEKAPVVGTVGRLAEVKRQDILIQGFALVRQRYPEARLLIVGDGPLRAELEGLAGSLGLGDRVHFVGYRPDPERFLRAMDVFALTSRSEGMPLSILEAWAAGVPVVATGVGGVAGLVEDGMTGLLVDPGDRLTLSRALTELLDDPLRARQISAAARSRVVASFGVKGMAAAYDAQYHAALTQRRVAR